MKRDRRQPTPQPTLSRSKRRSFAVAAVLLPLVLVGGTEGVLRLAGHGGYAPVLRVAGEVDRGRLVISDPAGAVSYFYANPSRAGYNNQQQFIDPKPEGIFRVFLVGESAAKGYPEPRNLASSAFLQAMLSDAWPDRTVEVLNLGTTAVASFPVLGMLKEALAFEPDLILIHTGHNEFFGAYGVNSVSRGAAGVAGLKATRFVHSLALVQAVGDWLRSDDPMDGRSLMEIMVGEPYTAPDDPIRAIAARNLEANIEEMLALCNERGVPAIVCTLPSNERDLHPVGRDRTDGLGESDARQFDTLLAEGVVFTETDPDAAVLRLQDALSLAPGHARAHFLLGRTLYAMGETNRARQEFLLARNLDPMPWRAPAAHQEAIRKAATRQDARVCDMEAVFASRSPGGCIGWELMNDHVHPTLRGQALMAEAVLSTLQGMDGPASLSATERKRVRSWEEYALELGDNPYDRYGVAHSMRVLFNVPFMRERNPEGFQRFDRQATEFEETLSPALRDVVRKWQSARPHAGGKRPITGMIARQLMREKRYEEALKYYEIAQVSVPEYTSWHMEYVYFTLVCRQKLNGSLDEEGRELALREIGQGRFLLQHGFSESGLTERYTGRLYQLRGEWAEAIPFLNASRQKLGGFDLVAADQALFTSLIRTGREEEARELAAYGAARSGEYARFYRQMLELLDQGAAAPDPPEP